jgi:hypothetical protein
LLFNRQPNALTGGNEFEFFRIGKLNLISSQLLSQVHSRELFILERFRADTPQKVANRGGLSKPRGYDCNKLTSDSRADEATSVVARAFNRAAEEQWMTAG